MVTASIARILPPASSARSSRTDIGPVIVRTLEGGPFSAEDDENGNHVAVINESQRQRYFDGRPALVDCTYATTSARLPDAT